ncbi:MAG: hypothetical protein EP346_02405 [Bacteroidetes bacterium]|nr:MAG: hypothetical protein EP346_02405 [Bacteroidota bacterium]
MLIRKNWTISEVLRRTWRINLIILLEVGVGLLAYDKFISDYFQMPSLLASVLGTAIAFFIGFLNNQAYDRWWEARKIWGEIVNDSRSWARSVLTYIDETPSTSALKVKMVKRHLAWLHCLKNNLRKVDSTTFLLYLEEGDREAVLAAKHQNNLLLQQQAEDLHKLHKAGHTDEFRFKAMDELLVRMTDEMGKCERIKNTVFPTSYVFFTKFFIFLFISINAMALFELSEWWAMLFGWVIGYVFYTTFFNGMMVMNPFENEPSDTPMSALTRTLERNLLEMLGEPDLPESIEPEHGDHLM